jgi:hypothetical protein
VARRGARSTRSLSPSETGEGREAIILATTEFDVGHDITGSAAGRILLAVDCPPVGPVGLAGLVESASTLQK